jgi:hypothetical protein
MSEYFYSMGEVAQRETPFQFSAENFHFILGVVCIGGNDWHAV